MFSYTADNHHVNIMFLNGRLKGWLYKSRQMLSSIITTDYNLKTVLVGMSLLFSSENVSNFSKHGNKEFLMALF